MKFPVVVMVAALLAVALSAPWGAGPARADDKAPPSTGVWVFDVRVVRVDSPHPEVAEQASPFPEMQATTIGLPWTEVLQRLKKRGQTTLLLDQRLTTLPGTRGSVSTERSSPILAVSNEDKTNTQYRAQVVKTSVRFEATPQPEGLMCRLEIRGVGRPLAGRNAPTQTSIDWNGSHPALAGQTLVFHHAEQVREAGAEQARSVEHYGFVTGRFLPSK